MAVDTAPLSPRPRPAGLVLPVALIVVAAVLGFWWTRPGHRTRHVQLRPIEQVGSALPSGIVESHLRGALADAGIPLITGGRDLAVGAAVRQVPGGVALTARFEDAREGHTVWRRTFALPDGDDAALGNAATLIARTVKCGLAAFDTRRPPQPPAAIPRFFTRCEASARLSRAAAR